MNITVNAELLAYIDPLTSDEYQALERSLLAEGCRDALVLWGETLVDGHNRHRICSQHGIAFETVQNPHFASLDDVHLWMIEQHLGRRSVSDFQRGVLALRKKAILNLRSQPAANQPAASTETSAETSAVSASPPANPPASTASKTARDEIAKQARISSNTVSQIEKIQKSAAPELVAAVKAGTISINAAASVASLPQAAQVSAVAGGKKELQQAARNVRQAKAVERSDPESAEGLIARLRQTISALSAENAQLRAQLESLQQPNI